ncbi:MAG: putative maltokinase [Propionivibrio sp.]|uniref:putative maltokinase n=1 Tax=Propionivibrio sp. TaxID=2212460 RepID=UPI001A611CFE|nr:putative maltokinase [Propionivibrio sp.]MBL8414136.1 putative maltokinase [Propionivibrio sp.]
MTPYTPLPLLHVSDGWESFFTDRGDEATLAMATALQAQLTGVVLPDFMVQQRWFAAKGERIEHVVISRQAIWKRKWLFLQVQVNLPHAGSQTYSLPLALAWEEDGLETLAARQPDTLARVSQDGRQGILYDAYADETFCNELLEAMRQQAFFPQSCGRLKFSASADFARLAGDGSTPLPVQPATATSSNTTLRLGDRLFLKACRRLWAGINPELEMGRFLTEVASYRYIAPLAGALEFEDNDGTLTTLALVQGLVASPGDAWSYTLACLSRFLDECRHQPDAMRRQLDTCHEAILRQLSTLGRRTGGLHCALATPSGDPAFDPQPITSADLQHWVRQAGAEAAQTLEKLERHLPHLARDQQPKAQGLLTARPALLAKIQALLPLAVEAVITRYHGDFHLGQVLLVNEDFVLIDFEGEPGRTLEQRRRKNSPLRDVAGMLRSFNYAANCALTQAVAGNAASVDLLEPFVIDWERRGRTAFLAGYGEAVRSCPVYPQDPQAAANLLQLFELEKAFYELRYELDNRPDWVHVPLGGLTTLLLKNNRLYLH